MNSKNLGILAIVTAAVIALAFWVVRGRAPVESEAAPAARNSTPAPAAPGSAPAAGSKIADALATRSTEVAEITVHASGKDASVKLMGDRWVVPQRTNYPADAERVRDALLSVAELTVTEVKTQNPEKFSFLGVQDPDAKDSPSRLVTFKDAQGGVISSLIIGNTTSTPGAPRPGTPGVGVYVRRAGENQAFECRGRLDPRSSLETDPLMWIRKEIDGLAGDRVKDITITHADGSTLSMTKKAKEDRDYTVAGVPAGRELKYTGATTQISTALSTITFDDVKPIIDIAQDATPTGSAEFHTYDGLVLLVDTSTKDGVTWATFAARYDAPPAAPETPGADKAATPPTKPADEVKKEVDAMNARFATWAFALQPYRVTQLLTKLDDLLKPQEEKKDGAQAPPGGEPAPVPNVPDK